MDETGVTTVKKRRRPNWSDIESIAMINAVQDRKDILLVNKFHNDNHKTELKKFAWDQVTDEVNIVSDHTRVVAEVRKKYTDLRHTVKIKAAGTYIGGKAGGVPAKPVKYSLVEEAMLPLIGEEVPDGEEMVIHVKIDSGIQKIAERKIMQKKKQPKKPPKQTSPLQPQDFMEENIVQQQKQKLVSYRPISSPPHSQDSTDEDNEHEEYVPDRATTYRPILPKIATSRQSMPQFQDSRVEYNVYEEPVSVKPTTSWSSPLKSKGPNDRQYHLQKETHCSTVLDQLLRDETFTDVTLTAEGRNIRAHRVVLCLASSYFRDVLNHEQNVQSVVILRDIKFAELKNIIHFIYTGQSTVDASELESFMKTAELLEISSLCEDHKNMNTNGGLNAKNNGSKFNIKKISKGTKRNLKTSSPKPSKNRKVLDTTEGEISSPEPRRSSRPPKMNERLLNYLNIKQEEIDKHNKAILEDSPRMENKTLPRTWSVKREGKTYLALASPNEQNDKDMLEDSPRNKSKDKEKDTDTESDAEEVEAEEEDELEAEEEEDELEAEEEEDELEAEEEEDDNKHHKKDILEDSIKQTLSTEFDRGETEEKEEDCSKSGSDKNTETSGRTSPLVVLYMDGNKIELK